MPQKSCIFRWLSESELAEIISYSERITYEQSELIFSEGDQVDSFYIIESGFISIFISRGAREEQICILEPGDYFGEMAIFNKNTRTASASAIEPTTLLSIEKDAFLNFIQKHPVISGKINKIVRTRNEELALKENLSNATGIQGNKFHVAIKGDPSLRETTFTRNRYESMADSILPQLISSLEDLLLNRCVFQVYVGMNNGEIRTHSAFDPFEEEIHTANKIVNSAYLDRHYHSISYARKAELIKGIYRFIAHDSSFNKLPSHWKSHYKKARNDWQPLTEKEIVGIIQKLPELRNIPNLFLTNFSISMVQDAIRLQFNCDGTHILSTKGYEQFIEENI